MKRITPVFVALALALVVWSCGGSSILDNTDATVYLTVEINENNPDYNFCCPDVPLSGDIVIPSMDVRSETKDPAGSTSANMDVNLKRWVITPYRTDGGTVASP